MCSNVNKFDASIDMKESLELFVNVRRLLFKRCAASFKGNFVCEGTRGAKAMVFQPFFFYLKFLDDVVIWFNAS